MRIIDLYPPMVAGALLAAMWALVTYRIVKRDRPGNESWLQILWFLASIIPCGLYLIAHAKTPVGYFGVMMTTMAGIAFATVAIFIARVAVFEKSNAMPARVFLGFISVAMIGIITVLPNL